MSNQVVVPTHKNNFYVFSQYDFENYIVPLINFKDIPEVIKLAALKRGKGYKRTKLAYEQKGSGKHESFTN